VRKEIGKVELFCDGASWGNPGKAGIGIVIYDENRKVLKKFGKFIGQATNNVAEYMALIYGLQEALILGAKEVSINLDSELLSKQLLGLYKVKNRNLRIFFDQVSHLLQGFEKVEIKNVERDKNKEADRLANQAIREAIKKRIPEAIISSVPKQKGLFLL